jgi:hypothetical protein
VQLAVVHRQTWQKHMVKCMILFVKHKGVVKCAISVQEAIEHKNRSSMAELSVLVQTVRGPRKLGASEVYRPQVSALSVLFRKHWNNANEIVVNVIIGGSRSCRSCRI